MNDLLRSIAYGRISTRAVDGFKQFDALRDAVYRDLVRACDRETVRARKLRLFRAAARLAR